MSGIVIQGNTSGTGTFTITAPNSDTSRTLTLPDEAGTVLTSASSLTAGNLSGSLPAIDGSALTGTVASGRMPAGSVLQVVNVSGPASAVAKTGAGALEVISASITPSSTSSKIYIMTTLAVTGVGGSNTWIASYIYRDSSQIKAGPYEGDAVLPNAAASIATNFLDSPSSTSSITYKLMGERASSGTDGWNAYQDRSSITLMEIAG